MPACDKYDLAEDKLKAFTRSSVRTKTLLCLKDKPKISGDLEDELKLRATTILHTLKDLVEEDLVTKDKRGFVLTNIGRIQAMLLDDFKFLFFKFPRFVQDVLADLVFSEIVKESTETEILNIRLAPAQMSAERHAE